MSSDPNKPQTTGARTEPPNEQALFSKINSLYKSNKSNLEKNKFYLEDFTVKKFQSNKQFQLPLKNLSQLNDLIKKIPKQESDMYKSLKTNVNHIDFMTNLGIQMAKIEKNEIEVKRLIGTQEIRKQQLVTEKPIIKNNYDFQTSNMTHSFKCNISTTCYYNGVWYYYV